MNARYLIFNTLTGKQVRSGNCPLDELEFVAVTADEVVVEHPEVSSPHGWEYQNGEVIEASAPPPPTLEELKLEKWDDVKDERNRREHGRAITPRGPVDCDETSRVKINGAVQMAMLAQAAGVPFNEKWTMADNQVVEHTGSQMVALGVAVGQHISACYARARELREAINAAVSIEELECIVWDAPV